MEKKTFGQMIADIWYRILAALGLCTLSEHNKTCDLIKQSYEIQLETQKDLLGQMATEYGEKIDRLQQNLDRLKQTNDDHQKRYSEMSAQVERLKNDTINWENVETIKELQKQLDGVYRTSRNFSFPSNLAMPGSTSMSDSMSVVDGDRYYDADIRMILMDDETARINREPDQKMRYSMVVDYMRKRGLFARIGERMLYSGAATLAMAYNEDCTNFDVYAEFVAKILPDAGTLKVLDKKPE